MTVATDNSAPLNIFLPSLYEQHLFPCASTQFYYYLNTGFYRKIYSIKLTDTGHRLLYIVDSKLGSLSFSFFLI